MYFIFVRCRNFHLVVIYQKVGRRTRLLCKGPITWSAFHASAFCSAWHVSAGIARNNATRMRHLSMDKPDRSVYLASMLQAGGNSVLIAVKNMSEPPIAHCRTNSSWVVHYLKRSEQIYGAATFRFHLALLMNKMWATNTPQFPICILNLCASKPSNRRGSHCHDDNPYRRIRLFRHGMASRHL